MSLHRPLSGRLYAPLAAPLMRTLLVPASGDGGGGGEGEALQLGSEDLHLDGETLTLTVE